MLKAMISVAAEQVASKLRAEVHGLNLATLTTEKLQIRDTVILIHNITLAQATVARSPKKQLGHREIRTLLPSYVTSYNKRAQA